jgi:hypothetical protein
MLCRETVALYCEMEQIIYKDPVRTSQETLSLRYEDQPVNAV